MGMREKSVAIITARGGSKGLPRKNVVNLAGKPLIAHTIEAAIKSKVFCNVVVTTDDEHIKKVSINSGAEVIDRPEYLSTDTANSLDVLLHVLDVLRAENYKYFSLLQPTSPLRDERHIRDAWKKYQNLKEGSLVSVVKETHSPFKLLIRNDKEKKISPLFNVEQLTMPRQELPTTYRPNGAIYISNVEKFLESRNLFEDPLCIYEMSKETSADIDSFEDLLFCEKYLHNIAIK